MKTIAFNHSRRLIAVLAPSVICASALCAQEVAYEPTPDEKLLLHDEVAPDAAASDVISSDTAEGGESLGDESNLVEDTSKVQQTADEGIQIQVERLTGASHTENKTGTLKVYSPWPAKPLAEAPQGWRYVPAPQEIAAYKQTVKLSGGNTIDLSITPFVLEPVNDGVNIIRIEEPGYNPEQHYAQQNTVGTMLQNSAIELEENEKHTAKAIILMQQLLSSLPQK